MLLVLVFMSVPTGEFTTLRPPRAATKEILFPEQVIHRIQKPFKGDLRELRKKRVIRALVSYSRTRFFIDQGVPRGFEYELLQHYEKFLNRKIRRNADKIKIISVPMPDDAILDALQDGRGDIAAAGITTTPENRKRVAFSTPYIPKVHKVIVHHKDVVDIRSIDDLSNRRIYVLSGRDHLSYLKTLNLLFRRERMPPLRMIVQDNGLAAEDILEFVNAGIMKITVMDEHIARAWAEVLPDIVVRPDLTLNVGGGIAWAVRKENPRLLASINDFLKKNSIGSLLGNVLFTRYYRNSRWINNPVSQAAQQKLAEVIGLFKKYSDRYGFDWMAVAAQAYQESELNNRKISRKGAVGIMQVLPRTASGRVIDIPRIDNLENNIHAGVKYLHHLRKHYFSDPAIAPAAQVDFAWAAYNAGPIQINRLRRKAARRGLDPDKWFLNVEQLAPRETVEYVANINKYYVAYKFYFESMEHRGSFASNAPVETR